MRAAKSSRFVIGSAGLAAPKRAEVKAGHGYYLGASSSPNYVLVLSVTDDRITYANAYSLEARTEQRWIAEDLIARGGATMAKLASEADGVFAEYARARAASHGAPVTLADYDRLEVTLEARDTVATADHYGAAQGYGCLVGGDGVTGFVVAGSRAALAGVAADARFAVASMRTVKTCPVG